MAFQCILMGRRMAESESGCEWYTCLSMMCLSRLRQLSASCNSTMELGGKWWMMARRVRSENLRVFFRQFHVTKVCSCLGAGFLSLLSVVVGWDVVSFVFVVVVVVVAVVVVSFVVGLVVVGVVVVVLVSVVICFPVLGRSIVDATAGAAGL